jgi:membrane protein YqaA with SNARE-associated domain
MNWSKLTIGALIGGIVYFLLGWLIYGILLKDAFAWPEGMRELVERKEEDMNMMAMIVSCLAFGLLLSYLLSKMGITNIQNGALTSAIIAALVSLTVGAGMTAMMKFGSFQNTFIDMGANAVCAAIAGAAITWWLGRK